ncbi:hypothetical protein D3C74_295930 [compost metagenome]
MGTRYTGVTDVGEDIQNFHVLRVDVTGVGDAEVPLGNTARFGLHDAWVTIESAFKFVAGVSVFNLRVDVVHAGLLGLSTCQNLANELT